MSLAGASHCRVVASFLQGIGHQAGWWYRVPKILKKQEEAKPFPPDKIMPHFRMVFGLTEDAAALVLELMELVTINPSTNNTKIRVKGWE